MGNFKKQVHFRGMSFLWLVALFSGLTFSFQNCSQSGFKAEDLNLNKATLSSSAPLQTDPIEIDFKCQAETSSPEAFSAALDRNQIENSIRVIFGLPNLESLGMNLDFLPESNLDDLKRVAGVLSESDLRNYLSFALNLIGKIYDNKIQRENLFGACSSESTISDVCLEGYFSKVGKIIYRRSLSIDEKKDLSTLFRAYSSPRESYQYFIAAQLASPNFLLRIPVLEGNQATGEGILSPNDIATKLAFTLTNATPDLELIQAAEQGNLVNLEQAKAQARRILIQSSLAKEKFRKFGYYWLGRNSPNPDLSSLPKDYLMGLNTKEIIEAGYEESEKFVENIIWNKNGRLSDLLLSRDSFAAHDGLASIYGHLPYRPDSGLPAEMPLVRPGILHRIPFLLDTRIRSPLIQRGVRLQNEVFCNPIPAPSPEIFNLRDSAALTVDQQMHTTSREIVAHMTNGPSCFSCHSTINPSGNIFEKFDSLGRYRLSEKTFDASGIFFKELPVSSRDNVQLWLGHSVQFEDSSDLITKVSTSPRLRSCFAKKVYEFAQAKPMTEQDGCYAQEVNKIVKSRQGTILDAIVAATVNQGLFKASKKE